MSERTLFPIDDDGFNDYERAQALSEQAREIFEATHGELPWMDDYWTLREEGWPWRQAVYILWASQPQPRDPATQRELATQILGLTSDRSIRLWRAKNPAIEQRIVSITSSKLVKHRADIYNALVASASTPDYKHHQDRKLALEMLGDYTPRQAVSVAAITSGDDVKEASTDELRALVAGRSQRIGSDDDAED